MDSTQQPLLSQAETSSTHPKTLTTMVNSSQLSSSVDMEAQNNVSGGNDNAVHGENPIIVGGNQAHVRGGGNICVLTLIQLRIIVYWLWDVLVGLCNIGGGWVEENKGTLLSACQIITAISFAVVVHPPGVYWMENVSAASGFDCEPDKICQAGTMCFPRLNDVRRGTAHIQLIFYSWLCVILSITIICSIIFKLTRYSTLSVFLTGAMFFAFFIQITSYAVLMDWGITNGSNFLEFVSIGNNIYGFCLGSLAVFYFIVLVIKVAMNLYSFVGLLCNHFRGGSKCCGSK